MPHVDTWETNLIPNNNILYRSKDKTNEQKTMKLLNQ